MFRSTFSNFWSFFWEGSTFLSFTIKNRKKMRKDVLQYLARINYDGDVRPSPETLTGLTAAHLESVPFENIDCVLGKPINLNIPALFEKVVLGRRGGLCYELNGLFHWLLCELGFKAVLTSMQIFDHKNCKFFQLDVHAAIIVEIDNKRYTADVGWVGPRTGFLPLELTTAFTTSEQPNGTYKIGLAPDGYWHMARKDAKCGLEGDWFLIGRFKVIPRALNYFESVMRRADNPAISSFPQMFDKLILMRKTEGGRVAYSMHVDELRRHLLFTDGSVQNEILKSQLKMDILKQIMQELFRIEPNLSLEEEHKLIKRSALWKRREESRRRII